MKRDDESIEDNNRDHLQAHYHCATWSSGEMQIRGEDENTWNDKVLDAIATAATQSCEYCHQNGAGIRCSAPDCASYYHYPCALMQGVSMDFKCFQLFCPKHSELSQNCCLICNEKGNEDTKLLSCNKCGRYWHPYCLSVNDTTYLRAGWTCEACKICQKCNVREDANQLLVCSSCDKAIHLSCTGLVTMPSSEWRCEECRCCIDCNSKSAGNGPSCRWHGGYTICSRCNQLRSKGSYCFICQGAYKQVTDIPMIQCDYCQKWIHAKCDKINRQTYDMLGRPKSRYFCPECREAKGVNIFLASEEALKVSTPIPGDTTESADSVAVISDCTAGKTELEEIIMVPDTIVVLQEGSDLMSGTSDGVIGDSLLGVGSEMVVYEDDMDDKNLDKLDKNIELQTQEEFEANLKLNSGLTLFHKDSVSKRLKKREILESYTPGVCISKERRPLPSSRLNLKRITVRNKKKKNRLRNLLTSQLGLPKGALTNRFRNLFKEGKRKYYRGKEFNGKAGLEIDHLPSFRPLIFPYMSRFLLYQKDLCACCGAGGQGKDSSLLVCAQCANSYHDYCLKTKVPSSRLRHGWRCPKCASCEGCGLATDEACLLMCDQCDILYHTYCLKPPLRSVPKGPWKCSWCVKCTQCASDSPGINGTWQKDFTLCAPCGSRSSCHICSVNYLDGDLIMKCSLCKRWSHGSCDGFNCKSDIQKMVQKKYYCSLCRHQIREKGLKNLLPYKQYIGHKKESNPFKKLRKIRRGELALDPNPSSQNSSFIDTGPADLSSSIDQTVIEDMNLLSSMNKNYASGITLEHNPTATIIQQPRDILKSLDAPRKLKMPAGLIAKKKSLKAMREESRKQRKQERRMKVRSTTEEDDNELDSFDKNILPHLTRYQKACLRWVMDEERGTLATKAPVLYANMSFTDLKDKYPAIYSAGWMDRARAVNNLWKKLPMTERQQYIDKAKLNREKLESEGVYQKRNPPRIIRLYAVKAFKLNQMTDQPQGLKRDFSTRRPRRTVAELQKAREEEDKVKKEIGLEDNKPRRKGRRIITGKKSSCFSSKNRNGLHTPQSSFSYHGDMHPDLMFCSPLPDEKSPLPDHHFPYVHQPFQPLLHGTKGSGDPKSHHSTISASDNSLSKLSQSVLPYSTNSPNSHRTDQSLVSPNCSSSQPFNVSLPSSLEITPHSHTTSQSPHEFPETKPFKSSNSLYPQTTGSSRHILQNYSQQGYKSGSYPHSVPIQSYPHSPFHHNLGSNSMHCYQNPHGYNYHNMHVNTPPYQGPMPYYYPHPHDPKYRAYSEQKPPMSSPHVAPRPQSSNTQIPDKPDLCLDFNLPPDTPRSSCSATDNTQTNGMVASDNRPHTSEQSEVVSLPSTPLIDNADKSATNTELPSSSSLPANSPTPDQMRAHSKPPLQPHTPLHSKYKHDMTPPYPTPKYPSPWGPSVYTDPVTPGDEFKKPLTPSEAATRSGGSRKKGNIGMSTEFPGYYGYNQQDSMPMGYHPPYYHPQDMHYPSTPSSPFNMQPLNQYPHDPTQHAKYKHNRRLSNPLEYSPTCPNRSTPKQLHRQGPHPFNPSPQPQVTPPDPSRQSPYPSFTHPSLSSQPSPLPNSPTSSKSLSEIPPFPKPNQKFSTVVLPSPSLERATTVHCVKTRDHPDLMEHLERIATSCNKRELNYFDCLELTNMTAEHTHMIDSLSTDTKTRYSLYEELNSILEVRRSSILRRYSTKPVRLKKQYLTKVLVEPVVPLEILIPSLSFLWSSPDRIPSNSADFYNSFPSFNSNSDISTNPLLNVCTISTPISREDNLSEMISSDTSVQNKSDSLGNITAPDATSTPLTTQNSATNSSLMHTLPTNSSGEEPLPLLATSSSAKHDSSLSDLNLSDCSSNASDPEDISSLTDPTPSRKRQISLELDSVESKKLRSSPLVSDNNSSMSLLDLGAGAGESASFSDQFQSLVQEMYGESTQFTLDKNAVSGIDIPLSLDQAIKEEMDSDKQESEQPNTALLFKKKPRQTRATKWAVWTPDFYKAFLKSAASRKCRRHKLMPQLLSTRTVNQDPNDERACVLCTEVSDRDSKEQGRLVTSGIDEWIHAGCAIWSDGVYASKDGLLENVTQTIEKCSNNTCAHCNKPKASIICFSCTKYYHLPCASLAGCHFYSDKSVECPEHYTASDGQVTNFFTSSYFYIQYCDATMLDSVSASEGKLMLRVGNVIFLKIGQLCPKVKGTYTDDCIYPVGYVCSRFYWSVNDPFQLSQYWCSITLEESLPLFSVYTIDRTQDPPRKLCIADKSIMVVWEKIIDPIQSLRAAHGQIAINKKAMKPEDFFGLSEPTIVKMIESLPGIEQMVGYNCKYPVRRPTHSLPIPYNPSGSARTELVPRAPLYRRHLIHRVASPTEVSTPVPTLLPQNKDTSKELVSTPVHITPTLSKNAQYRKLRTEWKINVRLAKSNIQGLGLFARRDIDKDQIVIEYIGEMIKNELADVREQAYNRQNRGCYMFRVDTFSVVDATRKGGFARYINHSCEPNCTAEIVNIEGKKKILIISQQKIILGEELTYDYKFEYEDTAYKIPCLCGSASCRKWMN
ncbi:Histone-lysine N-methyltransferase MLL3 [Oopsacas minuta]|uniref:Histone-lysine N-methyltransferase MLL3 n=1 Tax=Oopsacas minuta TaxID=111878 RepID=A0AAV7JB87_9METZ|nr:Histone-lysine N-methyltransferase MLL3 [Oopsacas minuta]